MGFWDTLWGATGGQASQTYGELAASGQVPTAIVRRAAVPTATAAPSSDGARKLAAASGAPAYQDFGQTKAVRYQQGLDYAKGLPSGGFSGAARFEADGTVATAVDPVIGRYLRPAPGLTQAPPAPLAETIARDPNASWSDKLLATLSGVAETAARNVNLTVGSNGRTSLGFGIPPEAARDDGTVAWAPIALAVAAVALIFVAVRR